MSSTVVRRAVLLSSWAFALLALLAPRRNEECGESDNQDDKADGVGVIHDTPPHVCRVCADRKRERTFAGTERA